MGAVVRFDLKMETEEKEIVTRAVALMGTTMAAFVRMAAKEKAHEILERESHIIPNLRLKRTRLETRSV